MKKKKNSLDSQNPGWLKKKKKKIYNLKVESYVLFGGNF